MTENELIAKSNLESLNQIIEIHNTKWDADRTELRTYYELMCDDIVSCKEGALFMDLVEKTALHLEAVTGRTNFKELNKINKYLRMIKPLTNFSIRLFVDESRKR